MQIRPILRSIYARIDFEQTTTYAASLSYYTALSLAPLLILFITLSSQVPVHLQENFLIQIRDLIGADASSAFELILKSAKDRPDLVSKSGIFGVVTLLLSASLIFGELKMALNYIILNEKPPPVELSTWQTILSFIKSRFLHIGWALSFIFIMVVSLTASSVISASLSSYQELYRILNIAISFLFYIGAFSLLFRYMPDHRIKWKNSIYGALVTALLFVFGKELIGLYLGNSAIGSSYGAAGSIIVLLVWVYYSSLITFIGAHVSAILFWKGPSTT